MQKGGFQLYNTAKALYQFWNSFGIPAYIEDNVPDDANMPYLTYRLVEPEWDSDVMTYIRLWYKDTSYSAIIEKIDEIKNRIGTGITIPTLDGYVALFQDELFCQFQPSGMLDLKLAYLSLIQHSVTV